MYNDQVIDDRGAKHALRVSRHPWLGGFAPDLCRDDLKKVRKSMIELAPFERWRPMVLSFAAILLLALSILSAGSGPSRKLRTLMVLSVAATFIGSAVAHFWRLPNTRLTVLVTALTRNGLCGCCAYELRGKDPEPPDGCTVCPECGAAWNCEQLRSV